MVGERLHELRTVTGHGVNADMGDKGQEPRQRPPPRMAGRARRCFALQPLVGQPPKQRRQQRQKEQRMRLRPVAHHVEQIIPMVDEHIQVGQRAGHSTNGCGFGKAGAAAHDGHRHAGAEDGLGQGVHVFLKRVLLLGRGVVCELCWFVKRVCCQRLRWLKSSFLFLIAGSAF